MTIGFLFWLLMVLWFIFGAWARQPGAPIFVGWGGSILEFALFFLLGWKVFGFVIQG